MPYKLSEKQRRFAQGVANGLSQTEAYIQAGYSPNGARAAASKLLTNANVQAYLQELQQKADDKAIMDIVEWQKLLTSVARGEVTEEQLAQKIAAPVTVKARLNDRLKAAHMLGQARGFYSQNDNDNDDAQHFDRIIDAIRDRANPYNNE